MRIVIASGKGGTGKTTVAVNLAYALAVQGERVTLLDCDVEEPNDHLFVKPQFTVEREITVPKPVWNPECCTACGKCVEACHYNALALVRKQVLIFNELCHSCGVCSHVCPAGAITEHDVRIGVLQSAPDHQPFGFAHGVLDIGEALAPNVVRAVKADTEVSGVTLVDAAPGTACPVVEALNGADVALLVTEPTPFGLHDLKLAVALTLKLGIPTGIIVNRSDGQDALIADYAREVGLPISGRIPFKRKYAEAYAEGRILADAFPELREQLLDIYDRLEPATPPVPPDPVVTPAGGDPAPFEMGSASGYHEITVISGKGGTGKTTLVASLADLGSDQVLADHDVDAADLHLLLAPVVRECHAFSGGIKAWVDPAMCIGCGRCAEACHFNAIAFDGPANDVVGKTFRIEPLACEGCGLCPRVCPVQAIRSEPHVTGQWFVSSTHDGPMTHARLGIAEENSGRLVTQVRNRSAQLATELKRGRILGDGPPGTGCPVIASVSGTDLVVIVTEPTVSGVHDMERVLKLSAHFRVPAVVVINKADLNAEQADRVSRLALENGSRVIGHIPFDRAVHDALMAGRTVIAHGPSPAADAIREIWTRLQAELAHADA